MKFDPDSLSQEKLNHLRQAAEAAWGDDTRHEKYIGHPQPSAGNCFVTAQWLAQILGGHVGAKGGHHFWVSPDKHYCLDLTGEHFAYPPVHPSRHRGYDEEAGPWEVDEEHKHWRPGPVVFKHSDHPLFKGFRILDDHSDHPRAQQFARKANLALKGKHVSSVRVADLLGPSGLQSPQQAEDYTMQAPLPFMLHDEPTNVTDHTTRLYKFVWANGQMHVSPVHDHNELFTHAGADPKGNIPSAVGYAQVQDNHVLWQVESNVSLSGLHKVLSEYSDTVGWNFDGMTNTQGQPYHESFGKKHSMWYTQRNDGHLLMSERPLPNAHRLCIEGRTAYHSNVKSASMQTALEEWAKDFGYKLADYPGGGDMLDTMKNREHLDVYNRGDTDFQPERNNLDQDLGDNLKCGTCGMHFNRIEDLRVHERDEHPRQEEIQDGHFPYPEDMDDPLPYRRRFPNPNSGEGFTTARTAVQVCASHTELRRHPRYHLYAKLFGYDTDDKHRFYGAYLNGQLVGYGAVRLNNTEPRPGTMYHVAPAALESTIAQQGLHPSQPEGYPKGVYLFHDLENAQHYAEHMQRRDDDEYGLHPSNERHIYQVDTRDLPLLNDPAVTAEDSYQSEYPSPLRSQYSPQHIPSKNITRLAHTEPEVLMIDALEQGYGIGTAILRQIQNHFSSFYTHADSEAGERLMRRCGMVNVQGHLWRYAQGQEPKDMIQAAIPFIYDSGQHWIHIGYPGQKTHDIQGKFTPGGIVEGYYEPSGKMFLIPRSGHIPYTTRQIAELWYHRFPQMEITSVEHEFPDGKTHKIAAQDVGNYVRNILPSDPAAHAAYQALRQAGGKVYAVGGVVRDALQGREPNDIDLMVGGLPPDQVSRVLEQLPGRVDLTGKKFGVLRYRPPGMNDVEIALPRQDKYETGRRGEGVITVDHNLPVEKDLLRRDFTANSMAVDLDTGRHIDPYGGVNDIEANVLRTTHPDSFREDPTRLIRAMVAHGRFGLHPDERTRHEMETHGHMLRGEAPDAINPILDKLFKSNNPAGAIRIGQETGVLQHIFPEVTKNWDFDQNNPHHNYKLGEHLLQVLENTSRLTQDPDVRFAALHHDVGKPDSEWRDPQTGQSHYYQGPNGEGANHDEVGARMTESRMRALNYPVTRINRVRDLITHHMFPAFNSPKGARKFLNRVGDHADDLLNLREADQAGKGQTPEEMAARTSANQMRELVDQARQQQAPTALSNLSVNGNDLIAMGMKPGPQIGAILRQLMNDVVEDPSLNERQALLDRAKQYVAAQPS